MTPSRAIASFLVVLLPYVTSAHKFDQSNYRDIEASLILIYQVAFGQSLTVRFSVAPNEKAAWRITALGNLAP